MEKNKIRSSQYFFSEISHVDRGEIYMEHLKRDIKSNAWMDVGVGQRQNSTFLEYGQAAYQIKGIKNAVT